MLAPPPPPRRWKGEKVCFCYHHQNQKSFEREEKKNKKTFLAGFSKEMPIYPKVHTKCSAVSHSASQSASFSLSPFFVPDVSQRRSQPLRPFLPPFINIDPSIHQSSPKGEGKRRRKEGRKRKEEEGASPTYLPA